jgi:acetyl-CoA acetyltransferase
MAASGDVEHDPPKSAAPPPIGRANNGSLVAVRADELMATVIRAALAKVPEIDPNEIVDVVCGNVASTAPSVWRPCAPPVAWPWRW